MIARLLTLYALGLPWLSCSTILMRAGLAVHILRTLPVVVALAAGIYVVSASYLSDRIGISGLAISLSLYQLAIAGMLYVGLYRWLKPLNLGATGDFFSRLGLATGLSVAAARAVSEIWPAGAAPGQLSQLGLLMATAIAAGLVLLTVGHWLNLAEARRVTAQSSAYASRWLEWLAKLR